MRIADDVKRERWERATGWPTMLASFAFLIAYSWNILDDRPTAQLHTTLVVVLVSVWAFFLLDYVVRLVLAEHKLNFVRHSLIDLFSVFIPLVRPFRLLTGLRRVPALRGNTAAHLRRRVVIIAGVSIIMFIYVIALAEFRVERYADGANIKSFGDSIWWACVTMATVGYGDYYPVTVPGRVLAVILMMGGIAIVGTASATIVSYLNDRTQHLRHREQRPDGTDQPSSRSDDAG
ncbi:potassium channel family protein [Leifsonia xyli]|uniref:potassium channel family protein n=1 Tax=Leifsonia xyli TaxID=1575 RepID=UPI003D6762A6